MSQLNEKSIELEIPFQTSRIAEVVYDVLRVDKEPKRGGVAKVLSLTGNILTVKFSAQLTRQLRVSVNGFLEKLDLTLETVQLFGPPVSESYSHY
ncbi:hypothetical protein NQ318_009789 [Aromia moschata]|uniref:L antigen family member 3 n=1 Tax=Aromia moschata TaxID=1265417 RepID=A0AAV8Y8H8_9CUCU|nr:hypothetical protein NQ318_009789 [Aromia moschata]